MQMFGIVLAAGKGKRMKSNLYKVLHPLCGKPMVGHVIDMLGRLQIARPFMIVGHGAETVEAHFGEQAQYVLQQQQLGTGHAVLQAKPIIGEEEGITIVICGDSPLVREHTLQELIILQQRNEAAAVILTTQMEQPHGYGRIIRGEDGRVERIIEHKDCTPEQLKLREINAGTFCFDNRKLFKALEHVQNNNAQAEYYLTDVIDILRESGEKIEAYCTDDATEALGINDRVHLAIAEKHMRERINRKHMENGVTLIDPQNTYIESDVTIGQDTTIFPGCTLRGFTEISEGCTIGPNTDIADCRIEAYSHVRQSVLDHAIVGQRNQIGPFAYLRPGTKLGDNVKVGDFVELKNTSVDDGSKIPHLSYVGDAVVGKNVNIGCGAITVNYDGFRKHVTHIADDAFIGSNVNLIAPVTVGKGAYVVAGSTITADVPEGDFAIARERQTNKAGYAKVVRDRIKAKQEGN